MSNQWEGLVSTIQKFKATVKDELDIKNESFHTAINGEDTLKFKGLGINEAEKSEYSVELSDVLFWHDPIAYMDEFERWEGQEAINKYSAIKEYLKRTDQDNIFGRLVESLKRKRVCPFVGAGLSRPCGYPLWSEAITKLVDKLEVFSASETKALQPEDAYLGEIKEFIKKNDYLSAAQIIYEKQKTQLDRYISDKFDGANSKEVRGAIKLLPQMSDGCIITTNFDELIEKVFQSQNKSIEGYMYGTQKQNQFASRLIKGDRCILKLHGHFNEIDTYIFSKSQYDEAYGNNAMDYQKPLSKVLRQIFISHSLLFLGCSLEQDRTLELFKDVVNSNAFDIPEHIVFLPDIDEPSKKLEKENNLDKAKIHPIWYEVKTDDEGNQDHSQLEDLLRFAIDCSMGKAKI